MAWQRSGTVSVTTGSPTVVGAGVNWAPPAVDVGYGFVGPDGATYEIAALNTANQLTLAEPYRGSGGTGLSYAIFATDGLNVDLYGEIRSLVQLATAQLDPLAAWMAAQEAAIAAGVAAAQPSTGTFLPSIGGNTGVSGQTYNQRSGRYTRIGNLVAIQGSVWLATKGTFAGSHTALHGLPFVPNGAAPSSFVVGSTVSLASPVEEASLVGENGNPFLWFMGATGGNIGVAGFPQSAIGDTSLIYFAGTYEAVA